MVIVLEMLLCIIFNALQLGYSIKQLLPIVIMRTMCCYYLPQQDYKFYDKTEETGRYRKMGIEELLMCDYV